MLLDGPGSMLDPTTPAGHGGAVEQVDEHFIESVKGLDGAAGSGDRVVLPPELPAEQVLRLFDAQLGSRYKVFGRRDLAVLPQTSTIASHLPPALGMAFAVDRVRKLGLEGEYPRYAVVVCSFGDASANHSTAVGNGHRRRAGRVPGGSRCRCS